MLNYMLLLFTNGGTDYERRKRRHMIDSNVVNKKQIKLLFKNKKHLKELKKIFDWVEEITIKLRLNIITMENLQDTGDIQYLNQRVRYIEFVTLVEEIVDNIIESKDKSMDILEKIRIFKENLFT